MGQEAFGAVELAWTKLKQEGWVSGLLPRRGVSQSVGQNSPSEHRNGH